MWISSSACGSLLMCVVEIDRPVVARMYGRTTGTVHVSARSVPEDRPRDFAPGIRALGHRELDRANRDRADATTPPDAHLHRPAKCLIDHQPLQVGDVFDGVIVDVEDDVS